MMKAMEATDDEIVEAVILALKPWAPQMRQIETGQRAGEIEAKSDAEVRAAIFETVRAEILRFRTTVRDFFSRDAIVKTRYDARDLMKSIAGLTEQLSAATLSPELRLRLGHHDRLIGSAADVANSPVPRLLAALQEVHDICALADRNQPKSDQVKRWCALIAFRLIRTFSAEDPSAGSDNTAYCTIAGLLYESVTREKAALRSICQNVLQQYRPFLPSSRIHT